jgi:ABC-type sugar transport system ATPase subunit
MTATTAVRPGLRATGISKSFNGNRVLADLDLEIPEGTVHALLGHNGSGKSTFIKILAGYHEPDEGSGSIVVDGREIVSGDPDSTRAAGVTFVHQTLGVVPSLSVLENLRLGHRWRTNGIGKIDWRTERSVARDRLAEFGLDVSPDALVGNLNTVEQTEVAIVRALSAGDDTRLLVLDEPTAALTDHEVKKLFALVERVKARGVAIIYVSHRLEEIPQIADALTVLRDGRTVGRGPVGEFPWSRLVGLIAGDQDATGVDDGPCPAAPVAAGTPGPGEPSQGRGQGGPPILRLDGLRGGDLRDGTLDGRPGEIVGAVGLLGSGVIDLARVLTGRLPAEAGSVELAGAPADVSDFAGLSRRGLGAVVGQRGDRVAMNLSVGENVSLGVLGRFFRRGLLGRRAVAQFATTVIAEHEVRCAGVDVAMSSLSGGNQQKAAIAKVLATNPRVLVLEEPCHGVDERGRREIRELLRRAADGGALVLVVDSDLDEVVGLCSNVVVFRDGRTVATFEGEDMNRQAVLNACYGTDEEEQGR